MTYKTNEFKEDRYIKPSKNRLSEQQLIDLDKEIEGFSIEKEVNFPDKKIIKFFDEIAWLKNKGALTENGAVIVKNYRYSVYASNGHLIVPTDCDPILFEQLSEDLEQWRYWKGRKEFIENKKIEGLEELASKMNVESL
mgnify:CR=1 FL=1